MSEYTGKRIVPKPCGSWEKLYSYEVLSVVLYKETGDSYIARKAVPSGIDISDTDYWMLCSEYSMQYAKVLDSVEALELALETLKEQVAANVSASTDYAADYAAEVVDARTGADGETYASLGDAIRGVDNKKQDAFLDVTGEVTADIAVNTNNKGQTTTFSHCWTTDYIPVNRSFMKVFYTGRIFNWIGIAGYNDDGNFVSAVFDLTDDQSSQAYTDLELDIPDGVTQIRASSYSDDTLKITVQVDSEKLWNYLSKAHARLDGTDEEIENLKAVDEELAADIGIRLKAEDFGMVGLTGTEGVNEILRKAIRSEKEDLVEGEDFELLDTVYIANTGIIATAADATWRVMKIPVSKGDMFAISGKAYNSVIRAFCVRNDTEGKILYGDYADFGLDAFDVPVFCIDSDEAEYLYVSLYTQSTVAKATNKVYRVTSICWFVDSMLDGVKESIAKLEAEDESLRAADSNLVETALFLRTLACTYGSNIWSASSPILSTYYVPLTVLQDVYVETLNFTLRVQGSTSLTVTIEQDSNIIYSEMVGLEADEDEDYTDIPITISPKRALIAGAYVIRLTATDKVLCYPHKGSAADYMYDDYLSNEASGGVAYDYSNSSLVFKGTFTYRTGGTDDTLSIGGMPADAAAVKTALDKKLDKRMSSNLLDPDAYRPGWFAFRGSSNVTYHSDNLKYGATDYIPVSENGLVTSGSGTNGVTSQIVYDADYKALRYVDNDDQYTYEEGDAFVVFCYFKSSAEKIAVVEGTEYVFEEYTEYLPLLEVEERVDDLEDRVDALDGGEKSEIDFITPAPVYTVCNDMNTSRNYHVSVWIDHLIEKYGWTDIASGFGDEMAQFFNVYSPFTNGNVNGGGTILEQMVEKTFKSEGYNEKELSFTHRSTLASVGKSQFPKVLVIGDSVTDSYAAGANKSDSSLPTPYWAWVRYLFELDRIDGGGSADEFNCLMVGMKKTIDGKSYGTAASFRLNGTTYQNYAVGKGGWSAEDLNLEVFESDTNINPFYDADTDAFSLKTFLDKYKTLDDDGVTRLVVGDTAGSEVTDVTAYDLCTPTHVVINLNHNSSLTEYQENIPGIVETIKSEYPDMIVILMSIDETGTYFPAKYPEYAKADITIGSLHQKNATIYEYFCENLQDEENGIYVCSGNLIQPTAESYPTFEYQSADSIGRDKVDTLQIAYGKAQYGGPNWHPNSRAHAAWGYELYALIKYTLALKELGE